MMVGLGNCTLAISEEGRGMIEVVNDRVKILFVEKLKR